MAFQWGLGGLVAAPFAILPHEVGHYVVLLAFGVPDLVLHYVAVTWDLREFWEAIQRADFDGATTVVPIWAVALSDAMGPLVTYGVVALMHPLILQHQITPKTSRYTRCSMSMLPNVSINERIRSSGQLGRWWYSISPCRNSECVRRFTVFAFNQRS